MKQVHCIVSGRVQGVGYRLFVKEVAERFQISGWVRNMPDGTVETIGEGEAEKVDLFLEGIRAKNAYIIRVDSMETEITAPEGLIGFEIRR